MSRNSSLPPPIRDSSGKTYIAIPAPSFVLKQDALTRSQTMNSAPGYVYVERKPTSPPASPHMAFTLEQSELPEVKPSISCWMIENCSAEPPPGHVPWIGEVPPTSSSPSIAVSTDKHFNICLHDASLASSMLSNSSEYSFEIPSFNSGDTLLDGSLPSTCSSAWSGCIAPPPISIAKSAAKSCRPESLPAPRLRKPRFSIKPAKDKQRFTTCIPDVSSRREALVFNRRLTFERMRKVPPTDPRENEHTLPGNQVLSQINKLDDFFSDGLKNMDSTMLRLGEEKNKLEAPSLVVSTSSAIRPVSLESCEEFKGAVPLAQRRGKTVPIALKIDSRTGLTPTVLDYPGIPTPFRGSPEPASETFPESPKYSTVVIDKKMTAEQMICSLREQVQSLYPKRRASERVPGTFEGQCKEVETWLEGELEQRLPKANVAADAHQHRQINGPEQRPKQIVNHCDTKLHDSQMEGIALLTCMFPSPPRPVENNPRIKTPLIVQSTPNNRVKSLQASIVQLPTDNLKSWNAKPRSLTKAKPRKSILSTGSSSGSGPRKKVRFSPVPPSAIPPLKSIFEKELSLAPTQTYPTPVSPPKRKPAPSLSSIKSPVVRSSLPPTPMKSSVVRKPSPLNPSVQSAKFLTPASRPASGPPAQPASPLSMPEKLNPASRPRSFSTGTPLKKRPLILSVSPNTTSAKNATDDSVELKKPARPLSFGANLKENRERTLTSKLATIAKRRSYAEGGNNADKENHQDSKLAGLVAREVQKKGGRRSLPFQNVLSRLRG